MDEQLDHRFTLANERTFLAWIRTGLALIAGGIAIRIFVSDTEVNWALAIAAIGITVLGGLVTILSYRHWIAVQKAMENGDPMPSQHVPLVLTVGIVALTLLLLVGAL